MSDSFGDTLEGSPPGASVHGISQARIREWVAISFSRGSSRPRDQTHIPCFGRWILYLQAIWEAPRDRLEGLRLPSSLPALTPWHSGNPYLPFGFDVLVIEIIQPDGSAPGLWSQTSWVQTSALPPELLWALHLQSASLALFHLCPSLQGPRGCVHLEPVFLILEHTLGPWNQGSLCLNDSMPAFPGPRSPSTMGPSSESGPLLVHTPPPPGGCLQGRV